MAFRSRGRYRRLGRASGAAGNPEFVFRFDRRWRETELFIRILHRALEATPFPYQQLTAERIG